MESAVTLEALRAEEYGDWVHVFHYANGTEGSPDAVLGDPTDAVKFDREDVESIEASVEGEREGPEWVIVGRLKDGRWFSIKAGCDYTGWG